MNNPCAACKLQRRKCTPDCIFAPYFPSECSQKFANVHRVFGASHVAKILSDIHAASRQEAVDSLVYEAQYRLRDPVYGCIGVIYVLEERLKRLYTTIQLRRQELARHIGPSALICRTSLPQFLLPHPDRPNYPSDPNEFSYLFANHQDVSGVSNGSMIREVSAAQASLQRRFLLSQYHMATAYLESPEVAGICPGGQERMADLNSTYQMVSPSPSLPNGSFRSQHHQQQVFPLQHSMSSVPEQQAVQIPLSRQDDAFFQSPSYDQSPLDDGRSEGQPSSNGVPW